MKTKLLKNTMASNRKHQHPLFPKKKVELDKVRHQCKKKTTKNSVTLHYKVDLVACTSDFNSCDCVPAGRGSRGGCMRCQQSRSLQLAVKILYGFVAFLVIVVAVLASLGEHQPAPKVHFC